MRIKAFSAACLVAGGLLALGTPTTGWAQGTSKGTITVAGEVGARAFTKEPDSLSKGKFEEYRDMRSGLLLEQLFLGYTPADSFGVYTLGAHKLFDLDQSMWLQAKRPGEYDFQVRWDRILHTYSTTARSPGVETNPGFNTLPIPRPDSIAWRNSPYLSAVRNQWDPVKVSLGLTPTEQVDFKADYLRIGKSGGIPLSMSFSGSSGPTREFVAPIDQTMHDFRPSLSFASGERKENSALSFFKSYQVMATYDYSKFQNAFTSTLVDNPQNSVASFSAGTNTGRASLAPNNAAQTGTVTGAVNLPLHTRVMGTGSVSVMTQNDAFLPQALNDSLRRDPNYGLVGTLPRASLDGRVKTTMVNLSATSRPINNLSLAAKYRNYDRTDETAPFHLLAMVVSDRTVTPADSETRETDPFTKSNTDLRAAYQLMPALSLTAGYSWENWKRNADVRNDVGETKEKGPRVSLDYSGIEWLTLHGSYATGERRGNGYLISGTEITDFRRFDLADRDRKQTNILATVTPIDQVNVSFNYQLGDDKFPNSLYGTQSDKSESKGVDVDWTPISRVSVSGGYSRDDATNVLKSRYRTGAAGSVTDNNLSYVWINTNTDKNTTTYASINAVLIPDKLEFAGSISNIDGHFFVYNVNPTTPTGGTAAQNLAATAENWPEVTQNLKPVSLSLRYSYTADWAMTLRYQAENYQQNDFRTLAPVFTNTGLSTGTPLPGNLTGNLPASIGAVTGSNTGQYHFLSSGYLPYVANWFTILISYHPSALPFSKARSTI